MIIIVHLHTVLQRQTSEGPVGQLEVSMPPKSTLKDLLTHLEIDFPLDSLLLVVNGRLAEIDHIIQEGDKINLMPAISGGSPPVASLTPFSVAGQVSSRDEVEEKIPRFLSSIRTLAEL